MNSRGYSRCRVRRVWSINPFVQRKHRGSRARESPSGRVTTFTHTGAHVRRRDARRAPPPRGRARRGSARTSAARLRSEANLIPATRLHGNSPRARDKRQPRRGHEKKKKSEKKKTRTDRERENLRETDGVGFLQTLRYATVESMTRREHPRILNERKRYSPAYVNLASIFIYYGDRFVQGSVFFFFFATIGLLDLHWNLTWKRIFFNLNWFFLFLILFFWGIS